MFISEIECLLVHKKIRNTWTRLLPVSPAFLVLFIEYFSLSLFFRLNVKLLVATLLNGFETDAPLFFELNFAWNLWSLGSFVGVEVVLDTVGVTDRVVAFLFFNSRFLKLGDKRFFVGLNVEVDCLGCISLSRSSPWKEMDFIFNLFILESELK